VFCIIANKNGQTRNPQPATRIIANKNGQTRNSQPEQLALFFFNILLTILLEAS
jgi:hypothetical protein